MEDLLVNEIKEGTFDGFVNEFGMHDPLVNVGKLTYLLRFASMYGRTEIFKFLHVKGANIHCNDNYPIKKAAYYGYVDIVQYILQNSTDNKVGPNMALVEAMKGEELYVIRFLLQNGATLTLTPDQIDDLIPEIRDECYSFLSKFCLVKRHQMH